MSDTRASIDPETLLSHGSFVRAVARSLLWDEHAAEDVVQQTWLAALGGPDRPSRGWLGAVARNLAIKRLRTDRRRRGREGVVARPEGVPSDAQVLERERMRHSVVHEVLCLPEPYRSTVLLRYLEELPPREVARRMDVPVETVRTRTRRAIDVLRLRLDEEHGGRRDAFCGALALWAGRPRVGGAAAATAGALGGGIMGTKAMAVVAGVVVAALAGWWFWPDVDAPDPPAVAADTTPDDAQGAGEGARREPVAARDEPSAPAPAPSAETAVLVVGGRVVDSQGAPVQGVEVWVSDVASGHMERISTDAEGRFETRPSSPGPCQVRPSPVALPGLQPRQGDVREVTPPARDLEFVLDRRPTATLVIAAFDVADGSSIPQSTCSFGRRVVRQKAIDGRTEALVRIESAEGDVVKFQVTAGGATVEREVAVREGERVEVRVDIDQGDAVRGRVVDSSGRPMSNALVFLGLEDVARGDEPFKPFDPKRAREGVRTDADGAFELKGAGRWVTVWHEKAGPVSVARGDAAQVVLPPRGTVRGVLRDADGAAVANRAVYLDRMRETTTDAEGRFEFTDVEPGTRGLSLVARKPKAYVVVDVAPAAATDLELRPGLPTVRVEWPGRTSLGRFVALVPLGPVGSMAIGEPSDGVVAATDVLPGRYLLLGEGGAVAQAEVAGPLATAVVGTGEIVVRAKAGTRVYVVPAGAGYLAHLLAGRMSGAGIPADGVQRFSGLVPGSYEIGVERDGVRATVEVGDGPVETTLE